MSQARNVFDTLAAWSLSLASTSLMGSLNSQVFKHAHSHRLLRSLSSQVPLVAQASCTSAGSRIPSPPRPRPAPARSHRCPQASACRARRRPGHPLWGESWHGVMHIGVPDPLSAPALNRHWHQYVATNAHRLPPTAPRHPGWASLMPHMSRTRSTSMKHPRACPSRI
ncbi:hypothetical protein BJV78DRAFT_1159165 [Lactifluus subvellereus]|nr:hypothetical protein BJV78DRAFT_1159165 [Lactifluus subvellereus]